jgi:hypothetical protein
MIVKGVNPKFYLMIIKSFSSERPDVEVPWINLDIFIFSLFYF